MKLEASGLQTNHQWLINVLKKILTSSEEKYALVNDLGEQFV